MKKNMSGKIIKKVTGVLVALAIATSGLPIADTVNYTKLEMVYADESSDFSVKVQTKPDEFDIMLSHVSKNSVIAFFNVKI